MWDLAWLEMVNLVCLTDLESLGDQYHMCLSGHFQKGFDYDCSLGLKFDGSLDGLITSLLGAGRRQKVHLARRSISLGV